MERRQHDAVRAMEHEPVRRVGKLANAESVDRSHLDGILRHVRDRPNPPGEHRMDAEPGRRDEEFGQGRDNLDVDWPYPDFLLRLPQCCGDRAHVGMLDLSAGETNLVSVESQSGRAAND